MTSIAVIPEEAMTSTEETTETKKAVAKTKTKKETKSMDKKTADVRKRNLDLASTS